MKEKNSSCAGYLRWLPDVHRYVSPVDAGGNFCLLNMVLGIARSTSNIEVMFRHSPGERIDVAPLGLTGAVFLSTRAESLIHRLQPDVALSGPCWFKDNEHTVNCGFWVVPVAIADAMHPSSIWPSIDNPVDPALVVNRSAVAGRDLFIPAGRLSIFSSAALMDACRKLELEVAADLIAVGCE
jgi:hypothetical protein